MSTDLDLIEELKKKNIKINTFIDKIEKMCLNIHEDIVIEALENSEFQINFYRGPGSFSTLTLKNNQKSVRSLRPSEKMELIENLVDLYDNILEHVEEELEKVKILTKDINYEF